MGSRFVQNIWMNFFLGARSLQPQVPTLRNSSMAKGLLHLLGCPTKSVLSGGLSPSNLCNLKIIVHSPFISVSIRVLTSMNASDALSNSFSASVYAC